VQDNTQQGRVDVNVAIILNQAQTLEFVHEKVDPGARGPNHFRQRLLRYFGKHLFRLVLLALLSARQKSAGQPAVVNADVPIRKVFDAITKKSYRS
jgi:hypothetical protein